MRGVYATIPPRVITVAIDHQVAKINGSISIPLERDIIPLRSRLTLGDGYTQGDIFDGINFRGAQLASDDNMLPDSQRGFAPVIHGIARGTAQVTIKQNGYDIYNSTVPPGPFTINDIYAAGNSGDLQVTIKEADGSTQILPYPIRQSRFCNVKGILVIPLRQENTVVEMRSRKTPLFPEYITPRPSGWLDNIWWNATGGSLSCF